jgi:hypothetical protein
LLLAYRAGLANTITWGASGKVITLAIRKKDGTSVIFAVEIRTKKVEALMSFKGVRVLNIDALNGNQ